MEALPRAPGRLESASRVDAPFGRVEVGRGPAGEEWIVYAWEGEHLLDARSLGLFQEIVGSFAEFHHRSLPAPALAVDERGLPLGLGYQILPADADEAITLEQFAAYYDGTMLNVHVVDFLRKLTDAVLAAHRYLKKKGAVERDAGHGLLLPSFVMVRDDRSLRVAGLGLAAALHRVSPALPRQFAEAAGQTSFLAPEARSGAAPPTTAPADLYSVGALTFFAACNVDPEATSHSLDELNLNIARQTVEIVRHCLRADPRSRYARLEEIVRALDAGADASGPGPAPANIPFARNEALLSSREGEDPSGEALWALDTEPQLSAGFTGAPPEDRAGYRIDGEVPLVFAKASAPKFAPSSRPAEPDMLLVQAGPSRLGSRGGAQDESPERVAYLSAFYMARTTVPVSAYLEFLNENLEEAEAEEWIVEGGSALILSRLLRRGYRSLKGAENLPANNVSWHGAKAFCAWLARKTGKPYRLPTEAEWERAARGPWLLSRREYPWGDDDPSPGTSRFGRRWSNNLLEALAPVDGLPASASPEGLLQMAGNVWEWCEDLYDRRAYSLAEKLVDPAGPEKGFKRVARGGGWLSGPRELRCSARRGEPPRPETVGAIGFRLALSPPPGWSEEGVARRSLEEQQAARRESQG